MGEWPHYPPFRSPYGKLVFHVPHCKEGPRLRQLVIKGGGDLTDVAGDDRVLHLIPDGGDTTCIRSKWAIAAQFVEHCVAAKKLLNLEDYRLSNLLVLSQPATTQPTRHGKPRECVASSVTCGSASSSHPSCNVLVRQVVAQAVADAAKRRGCAAVADDQDKRSAGAQGPAAAAGPGRPRRHVGRLRFDANEDKALVQWVAQHPSAPDQGRQLWEQAERISLTRHSWQSMQNRWRRYVQPRLASIGAEWETAAEDATTSSEMARKRRCVAALTTTRVCHIAKERSRGECLSIVLDDELEQFQDSLEEAAKDCRLADGSGDILAAVVANGKKDASRSLPNAPDWLSNLQDASMHVNPEDI